MEKNRELSLDLGSPLTKKDIAKEIQIVENHLNNLRDLYEKTKREEQKEEYEQSPHVLRVYSFIKDRSCAKYEDNKLLSDKKISIEEYDRRNLMRQKNREELQEIEKTSYTFRVVAIYIKSYRADSFKLIKKNKFQLIKCKIKWLTRIPETIPFNDHNFFTIAGKHWKPTQKTLRELFIDPDEDMDGRYLMCDDDFLLFEYKMPQVFYIKENEIINFKGADIDKDDDMDE